MNSSSKKTALSFLAAATLGAAVFACTTTSGTVDDTNGGTKDSGTKEDTGTGNGGTCESKQKGTFVDETCQACLDTSCCSELTTCYDIAADADGGKTDCDGYDECIDNCTTTSADDDALLACYDDCDFVAAGGVKDAYEAIESCAKTSCATECGAEEADGG